jgi:hypothetical protein
MLHPVRGYRKKDGTYVRPHLARNPRRRSLGGDASGYISHARPAKTRKAIIVTVILGVAGLGTASVVVANPWGSDSPSAATGTINPSSAEGSTEINLSLNRTQAALIASGYGGTYYIKFDKNCASNSYGRVRTFFLSNPCKWLARASLILGATGHAVALVSISWVEMPNAVKALQYKHLVDTPRTGNVTELTRIEGPYQDVHYSGLHYVSGKYLAAVWNTEVQPISQLSKSVTEKIVVDSRQ